jgi:hypothetical protein
MALFVVAVPGLLLEYWIVRHALRHEALPRGSIALNFVLIHIVSWPAANFIACLGIGPLAEVVAVLLEFGFYSMSFAGRVTAEKLFGASLRGNLVSYAIGVVAFWTVNQGPF